MWLLTDGLINLLPVVGKTTSLGNRFNPLATDRVILGQYETSRIINFGEKSTVNLAIHLRLIPDKFGKRTISQPAFHGKDT